MTAKKRNEIAKRAAQELRKNQTQMIFGGRSKKAVIGEARMRVSGPLGKSLNDHPRCRSADVSSETSDVIFCRFDLRQSAGCPTKDDC
jgi:uncharacterized linocin/CFP29 family protein